MGAAGEASSHAPRLRSLAFASSIVEPQEVLPHHIRRNHVTSPNTTPGGGATATGLTQNMAGALAYLLGPITGIILLVVEKENRFVRFHAMQSTILSIGWIIISYGLRLFLYVPLLGWIVGILTGLVLTLGGFILWVLLMWKAFQGEEWELPVVGEFARKQLGGAA